MFFFLGSWMDKANAEIVENVAGVSRAVIGNILNIIRIVGTGAALIMLAVMSIGYFTADGRGMPGNLERQADIKGRQLTNFAIGVAVFIGASNIIYFIATFVMELFETTVS